MEKEFQGKCFSTAQCFIEKRVREQPLKRGIQDNNKDNASGVKKMAVVMIKKLNHRENDVAVTREL